MLSQDEFIKKLQEELNCIGKKVSREEVYNEFEKYVENKTILLKSIKSGIFYYDYVKYMTTIKGTDYEKGIETILDLCKLSAKKNPSLFKKILEDSYREISNGYKKYTDLCWLEGDSSTISRNDLNVRKIFLFIGDWIENSFKPYASFLDQIRALNTNKKNSSGILGDMVNALINYQDIFKVLYKDMFYEIPISQWRNIADHGSFETKENTVKVTYGKQKIEKEVSIEKLEELLIHLDRLLYAHKIAYTLLVTDYFYIFKPNLIDSKTEETQKDDLLMQVVETSYSYGFELNDLNKNNQNGVWDLTITSEKEIKKDTIIEYCETLKAFLKEYNLFIIQKSKVSYRIALLKGKLVILKL